MNHPSIAIVGMACRYPDANNPSELWENVLAQRRSFRRLPRQRLNLDDYLSEDHSTSDTTYCPMAAVLEGYEFDRSRFRIAGSTFRSADMAHWLALEAASDALDFAWFAGGEKIKKKETGVLLGNSLTGEFSRANLMRLRWPYVRRVLDAELVQRGWSVEQRAGFLAETESRYKAPFPPVGDETLAGGLSNTIAGRICNYFDLNGGGYTVDGACASSLLSVASACSSLVAGDLEVALAGGVDLSLDPFELIGFAKVGALAPELMRVYDARSAGFWPGEGCGFVVLMREEDAVRQRRRVYAVIRGWGVSSDGSGGITRPELEGQRLSLERAYRRAGFGIGSVSFFEGHGTGTTVGDDTELRALNQACQESGSHAAAAIGSIKANIGHTKAAAGVAGLIKATLAVDRQLLPPTTGWEQPNPVLREKAAALRLLREAVNWPSELPPRAAVSGMGFGGINAHVTMQAPEPRRRSSVHLKQQMLLASQQDAELFLLAADSHEQLCAQLDRVNAYAGQLSFSQLADLAETLAASLVPGRYRAALVAATPQELDRQLRQLRTWLDEGIEDRFDTTVGIGLSNRTSPPAIGLLFPSQGATASLDGGIWSRRFTEVAELYRNAKLDVGVSDVVDTRLAQPAIITAELAGIHMLDRVGIQAGVAIGHSLGELACYCWAGVIGDDGLLRLAHARGAAISRFGYAGGGMASISADEATARNLIKGTDVQVAGINSPTQTVVSGEMKAIENVVERARRNGLSASKLRVSHAFHSPLVADSASALLDAIRQEAFSPLRRRVSSTITGRILEVTDDLEALLLEQLTSPVRFIEAVRTAAPGIDLWIEVGPGTILAGLASQLVDVPVLSTNAGSDSLQGLLSAVGAAYVFGAPINHRTLFEDRFTRPFELDWQPSFLTNPCELAPAADGPIAQAAEEVSRKPVDDSDIQSIDNDDAEVELRVPASILEVVRQLAAERSELAVESVHANDRLLNDLHLSSIAVGQLVVDASRQLHLPAPTSPTDAANATIGEVAAYLQQLKDDGQVQSESQESMPVGVDRWVRAFTVDWVEQPLTPVPSSARAPGRWQVVGDTNDVLLMDVSRRLEADSGGGVLVVPPAGDCGVDLLLETARNLLELQEQSQLVFVQRNSAGLSIRREGAAFARSLHLELGNRTTCVVHVPDDDPRAVEWVAGEVNSARGFMEVGYDEMGRRFVPRWSLLPLNDEPTDIPLDTDDVLLVTGGGKGIAAECAFALAKRTGVRLALVGRSDPTSDVELQRNLQRFEEAGVPCGYWSADVTDKSSVSTAIKQSVEQFGPITGVLHGAGVNQPQSIDTLDETAFSRTLGPKVTGLQNILECIEAEPLRLLVTFGSIIARLGMRGQADYAVANEWLANMTEVWQQKHPHCHCVCLEWSVWSGVGMGEKLGAVDALRREGIAPITPDDGIRLLEQLISRQLPAVRVVVTGRFGNPATIAFRQHELPLLRFLEQPRAFTPGVELVADAKLSLASDPYLQDHVYQGVPLFLAVMGLEAMAQVATAVTGRDSADLPTFENVELLHPIVIPEQGQVTIRTAAIVQNDFRVELVIRSEESGFQQDHFRAVCRFQGKQQVQSILTDATGGLIGEADGNADIAIDTGRDLYGNILFHRGRFQRVQEYRYLNATQCVANIAGGEQGNWFGRYLPTEFLLGDAAMRDAVIHAIQACIPHGTLLPTGVERIIVGEPMAGCVSIHATERTHQGSDFLYDIVVVNPAGSVVEVWQGLGLRRVDDAAPTSWPLGLMVPYLERRVNELVPGSQLSIALSNGNVSRRQRGEITVQRTLGTSAAVSRRPDGKPDGVAGNEVSVSHADCFTMAVAAEQLVACDVEVVSRRSAEDWQQLLGSQRFGLAERLSSQLHESLDSSATRVWTAAECLEKSEGTIHTPVIYERTDQQNWILLKSGAHFIASWIAPPDDQGRQLGCAFLLPNNSESSICGPMNTGT